MPDEKERQYLWVAIDRASRMVCLGIYPDKSATSSAYFVGKVVQHFPIILKYVLTDNGKEFTDRFTVNRKREPSSEHLFDKVCADIKVKVESPDQARTPQTNALVERFNGRISELLQTTTANYARFGNRGNMLYYRGSWILCHWVTKNLQKTL
jgi:hypothetical protein